MKNQPQTIIGKDLIESLTLGMYEDAPIIYREYIQNSADAIDKAVELGLLSSKSKGWIEIDIDSNSRSITIEDNGIGIKQYEAVVLKNIAQSYKQRSIDKGFRGIGRLGGLAYCDKLIFETSYAGEDVKTVMFWDSKRLKDIINDRNTKESAVEVIDNVTTYIIEKEDKEKHYFKVTLQNVTNDLLLNSKEMRAYLEMIAPIPFRGAFNIYFKEFVKKYMNEISLNEYKITVNEEIHKPYRTEIKGDDKKVKENDKINHLEFFEIKHEDILLGFGWYGVSSFSGILSDSNIMRGIRLRKHNIQIGNEHTLSKLHKDTKRGNLYFIGEVHALHADLIPNARRDYFNPNEIVEFFENSLKKIFEELHQAVYYASDVRSVIRKIEQPKKEAIILAEKIKKNDFIDNYEKEKSIKEYGEKLKKAEENKKKFEKLQNKREATPLNAQIFKSILENKETSTNIPIENTIGINPVVEEATKPYNIGELETVIGEAGFWTDILAGINKAERKLVGRVFSVIAQNLPDKKVVEALKQKLIDHFNKAQ